MRKTKTPPVIYGLGEGEAAFQEQLAKSIVDIRTGKNEEKMTLTKSILNILDADSNISRLAFETDPTQVNNFAGVYHAKLRLIPDSVLKRIAIQDSLVASVVRARQNHLTSFGRPRPDRFSSGFVIKPNTGTLDKLDPKGKEEFAKQVERAIKLFSTCGHTEGVQTEHQRTLSEYLGLSVRSAVVCGRIATEIVHVQDPGSNEKRFSHFVCTDAGTIYRATTDKTGQESIRKEAYHLLCKLTGEKLVEERWNDNDKYSWVQVIDGTPKQVFTNEEMKVYNFYPVPDVELDGYPVTPIDTVITAITTHVNITTHNKLYFQSGRATRGMLILKSDDVSPQMLHQLKQNFNASINSSANCLDGSSTVWTKQFGSVSVADLESKTGGIDKVDIWTGKGWEKATSYKTGKKRLVETSLTNGITIKTSPDHRFRTIDSDGELTWKIQDDLKVGDYVAINKASVDGETQQVPLFNGKPINEDLMEVFGWITGDGCIRDRAVTMFYHSTKEPWIRDKHLRVLEKYDIVARPVDSVYTEEQKDRIKRRTRIKSVSDRIIQIYSGVDFARKVLDLGFKVSRENKGTPSKIIPPFIYSLPEKLRAAFLRGLFSADGNNAKLLSPCLTVTNPLLRENTKRLLLTLGIRTCLSEGKTRTGFVNGANGHHKVEGKTLIRVKDRKEFFDKIGFLQSHKQPRKARGTNKDWGTSNSVSRKTVEKLLRMVKSKTRGPRGGNHALKVDLPGIFTNKQQMDIDAILRGEDSCSLNRLLNYLRIAQITPPQWLLDYSFEKVSSVVDTGTYNDMYDIEVCDNDHAVVVDGAVLHNSWRMPVIGVPTDSELAWQPLDTGGGRDMEFQYLTDMNAREIMTAFMMSPDELPGWSYLSRGTASQALSECVAPWSRIITSEGLVTVADVVGTGQEKNARIWSGRDWVDGRVFKSGLKSLKETELGCGVKVQTSPDHRFRVVNDNGELEWKRQSELSVGDKTLVGKKPVKGIASSVPSYKGRKLTSEMMEVLGWLMGDGCLVAPKKRTGAQISFMYHHEKERDVWKKQKEIMEGFGLRVSHTEKFISEEERERIKKERGFKSIASSRIRNTVYDTDFYRWLISLGFTPSGGRNKGEGKTIPALLHVLPVEYRYSFLRGLFSADGHATTTGSIILTIHADKLRDQVRQLLLSVGIRTLSLKGLLRRSIGGIKTFSPKLSIKDRTAYWENIGFVQQHKKDRKTVGHKWTIDSPPQGLILRLLQECVKTNAFSGFLKSRRDTINGTLKGRSCSYQFLSATCRDCGVTLPEWMNDYQVEKVAAIRDLNQRVEMYDIEMYDDTHAFTVDGVITHNSNGEYKLTAARDVGIRPLLASFEDFLNAELFPLIDADLAKKARISLVGLEANTPEKEATQLQTTAEVYLSFDDILQKVEKEPVGKEWCGEIPLNPIYQSLLDKYCLVGEIRERFMGIKGASKDPQWAFSMNPVWLQMKQMQAQAQQQAAQQQQGPQGPGGGGQGGQPEEGGEGPQRENPQDDATEKQRTEASPQAPQTPAPSANALGKAVEQAWDLMVKSEDNLPPDKRKILDQHKKTVEWFTKGFQQDTKDSIKEILDIAKQLSPRGK